MFAAPEQHGSPAYVMYKMGMFLRTYQMAVARCNLSRGQLEKHL
jgi:hypothetical protein